MPVSDELLLTLREIGAGDIADGLEDVATGLDEIKKSQAESNAVSDKAVEADQEHKKSLLEVNAALDLFGKGINIAKEFAQQAIGDTMAYAKSVRDLSTNIGISVEETSKIIQAADDYGISTGEVTSALQMMTKRGIAPSIDKLAEMADQFVATADPIKRAELMTEAFGRGWTTLTPLLKEGGAALKASADEAEKMGLVLSEKDVKAARQLEINIDNLNDRVESFKLKVGNALIPILNDAADGFDRLVSVVTPASTVTEQYERAITVMILRFGENSDEVKRLSQAYQDYLLSQKQAVEMTDANDRALQRQAASLAATIPLTQQQADGMKALALANQTGGQTQQDYNKWLSDEQNAVATAALSMKELTTQTIYNTAAAGLDANSALVLAEKMGLVDKNAYGAAKAILDLKAKQKDGTITIDQYADSVNRMQKAIASLTDKNVEITLTTIMQEVNRQKAYERGVEGGLIGGGRAYGGAVGAGVPYIIGEHGREQFIPQQAGIVVPNNITTSITNNITTNPMGVALAMARAQQMAAEARM